MTPLQNPKMIQIASLMTRMVRGFHAHAAALLVARNPATDQMFRYVEPGQNVPIGRVETKSGLPIQYHLHYYLHLARTDSLLSDELERTWIIGTLLTIGDALEKEDYFDHAPELELIYHLRNGIAHGNKFNINRTGLTRLQNYPAHNRRIHQNDKYIFEISPALNGQKVLPDFMYPGDIIDLLQSAGFILNQIGWGESLPPPRNE